eukprot:TRINITY_DN38915_c0_g1_i1.p1 TRINITY_DN38915_c0_g1~~TRINITY_DN38915_c0_g1_i1.p1  ORF type:complete len:318 (-),score=34.37 TRINITY_DN38915_c0_g1_i1:304-1227(-)
MGVLICVGDIHGHIQKLQRLWTNLRKEVGDEAFEEATVIFLGDYCDRGPDTRSVIEFLISLPHLHPRQKHVFLCGNHDFAFSAFLGVGTFSAPLEFTWEAFKSNEHREGWWSADEFYQTMHVQGRRWAGFMDGLPNPAKGTTYRGSIYDSLPTFLSYGVPHGHPDLKKVVPEAHKRFLEDLVWMHEEVVSIGDTEKGDVKLIAVHAGLEKTKSVKEQLELLMNRDVTLPRIEPLSGRRNVWEIPSELLETNTLLVSGHHGVLYMEGNRFIIDESGGLEHRPIAAIVFPSRKIVRDADNLKASKHNDY